MARIRAKNTTPELVVRRLLHGTGYRFRTHAAFLPGTPDLAFTRRKKVVLVHGCFWHRHPGCPRAATPASRVEFWNHKFEQNRARDERVRSRLLDMGWDALVIWECETKQPEELGKRLTDFLGPTRYVMEAPPC